MSKAAEKIRVLVADANRVDCQLLAIALMQSSYHLQVVGSAQDTKSLLRAIAEWEPDVVLISADLQDGPGQGFYALGQLRNLKTKTKPRPVMLLESSENAQIVDAFRGGARGVFCRSDSIEKLPKCIWSVHSGQIWASSKELHVVLDILAQILPLRVAGARDTSTLTRREEQIVRLVGAGLTNRQISRELNLSEHTVKNYVFRLYEKLGLSSRVEMAVFSSSHSGTAKS